MLVTVVDSSGRIKFSQVVQVTTLDFSTATLTGQLGVPNGGTGLSALATGRIPYGNGTSPLQSAADFTFDGTTLVTPGQIQFPSTPNPSSNANTLDEYEEGTWSPTIQGTSGSGQTYAWHDGYYIKIGKFVFVACDVKLTATGTITGAISVGGLPVTVTTASNSHNDVGGGSVLYFSGLGRNEICMSALGSPGASQLDIYGAYGVAAANPTRYWDFDITNSTRLVISAVYQASA